MSEIESRASWVGCSGAWCGCLTVGAHLGDLGGSGGADGLRGDGLRAQEHPRIPFCHGICCWLQDGSEMKHSVISNKRPRGGQKVKQTTFSTVPYSELNQYFLMCLAWRSFGVTEVEFVKPTEVLIYSSGRSTTGSAQLRWRTTWGKLTAVKTVLDLSLKMKWSTGKCQKAVL